MTDKTLYIPINGPPVSQTPTLEYGCEVSGYRAVVLPPGDVELALKPCWHVVNVMPIPSRLAMLRVGGENLAHLRPLSESICWTPCDVDLRIVAHNPGWEINVEFDPERTEALAHEALEGRRVADQFIFWRRDPTAVRAASLLIDHLRGPATDSLYAEGLMLATLGRALRLASGGTTKPSTSGTNASLRRVVEYIHAHFNASLAMAELAAVAGMSPWQFARAFKKAVGDSPHQYVLRERVTRARELLRSSQIPLAQVALDCGFTSQSHMTQAFKSRVGVTPGRYRREVRR